MANKSKQRNRKRPSTGGKSAVGRVGQDAVKGNQRNAAAARDEASSSSAHQPDQARRSLIPPGRGPLLALFLTVTIGSIVVWSAFMRQPNLQQYTFELINTFPHDKSSFTQGFYYRNGFLFESTGREGQSKIRKIELKSGNVVKNVDLDEDLFGEGLTGAGDKLIQLTWKNQIGFVYDFDLNQNKQFAYDGEGWGLTFDGKLLIMSDGTSTLTYLDPTTFEPVRKLMVRYGTRRLTNLNELEYINGLIYANVWYDDSIYQISPENGNVVGVIDLSDLYPQRNRATREDVLNGIAVNPENGTLLVTGKHWPNVFEIKVRKKVDE